MKKYGLLFAAGWTLALASCARDKDNNTSDPPPKGAPVETGPPNTGYSPAFSGQTRAGSVKTTTPVRTEIISTSLNSPWGITGLPDGRLLITEKTGTLRIAGSDGTLSGPIAGLPPVNPAGQGGLLGLCIDPGFAQNRMVYWVFSEVVPEGNVTAVAKGRLSDNETVMEGATVIYRAHPAYAGSLHYGGRILFDATGQLLVSTGERSDLATRPQAQSVASALGKIIRITKDGAPAPGNPSFSEAGALAELYSIGHRNPQGLAIHPATGVLWQSEHGPRGGDELNRVQAGRNYGWPRITYGLEYSGAPVGEGIQQLEGMEQPVYYWDPVISPSGMTFYQGDRVPEWKHNLFIGALSGQHIVRLVLIDERVWGEERLLAEEGQRFRDIAQGTDGALYAVTDQGRLYRIDRE